MDGCLSCRLQYLQNRHHDLNPIPSTPQSHSIPFQTILFHPFPSLSSSPFTYARQQCPPTLYKYTPLTFSLYPPFFSPSSFLGNFFFPGGKDVDKEWRRKREGKRSEGERKKIENRHESNSCIIQASIFYYSKLEYYTARNETTAISAHTNAAQLTPSGSTACMYTAMRERRGDVHEFLVSFLFFPFHSIETCSTACFAS